MSPPSLFIDRSLGGKVIARALRADGWDIVTMREFYGSRGDRMPDVEWIAEQANLGHAMLSADRMIFTNPVERAAVEDNAGIVFVLPTGQLTGTAQAERFIRHREAIHARASWVGPAGFVVYESTLSRVLP
jgi:hypothetical protein